MSKQLFGRTSWDGKAVARRKGVTPNLTLPFELDDDAVEDLVIKADVPKVLRLVVKDGLPRINRACVRENAERMLKWYEDVIINHVLYGQSKTESFKVLTDRRLGDLCRVIPG